MKSGIDIRKVLNQLNELDFNIAKDRHAFGEIYAGFLRELQSAGRTGDALTSDSELLLGRLHSSEQIS